MNTAAEPSSRAVPSSTSRPLRVFIVEDSPVILDVLITTLTEVLDVDVVGTAADEATVVAWMRGPKSHRADVMIVDLLLAGGSGLAVLQAANDNRLRARRVVLTNYATHVIRERCTQLGAVKVFDKSTELEDLVGFLGDVAASRA